MVRREFMLQPLTHQSRPAKHLMRKLPNPVVANSLANRVASMYMPCKITVNLNCKRLYWLVINAVCNMNRSFGSDGALQSHTKAKHSAGK